LTRILTVFKEKMMKYNEKRYSRLDYLFSSVHLVSEIKSDIKNELE